MDDSVMLQRDPLAAPVLPSSVPREIRGSRVRGGTAEVRIYCANCGVDGGWVPEPSKDFAFFLCDENQNGCAMKWSPLVDHMVVPQERFWAIARQEQLERLGREMTDVEILNALGDPNHWLHTLLRSERELTARR